MRAAIYARKSTDQAGVSLAERSVARQVEHARTYATGKGWAVLAEHVYVDDGISGAEFANRPGFVRLMAAAARKPRPFDVLVMSEESRLGREQIETAYALKQLITAGIRVFFFLEDRERTFDSPTDKLLLSVTAFADELEREKARQRVSDAMWRKARAGHVTGGRTFGYENVVALGDDGKPVGKVRRPIEAEAAVVRRIFTLAAAGEGYARIARTLNADGAPAPRAERGRPCGWSLSAVYEVLRRPLYRGELVYGKTKQRDRWGQTTCVDRPEAEWVRVTRPELRIVPEPLWRAAQARMAAKRLRYLEATGGKTYGRVDRESKYLLPGFARCGVCGGGLHVRTRRHGHQGRVPFYACTAHWQRGPEVCPNDALVRLDATDTAVLTAIAGDVLEEGVIAAVIEGVLEALAPEAVAREAEQLRKQGAAVEQKIANLTAALEMAGPTPALIAKLHARQRERDDLQQAAAEAAGRATRADRGQIEARVRAKLQTWQTTVQGDVAAGRAFFREVLTGPIVLAPPTGRQTAWTVRGAATLAPLFEGAIDEVTSLASPNAITACLLRVFARPVARAA